MTTVGARFAAIVAVDPTRPLLTWYDDGNGERTELSGATLANWVAKTANLLVDGVGVAPGDAAVVLLPPLAVGASIVLCGHLNPEEVWERVGAERVTRNLAW